MSLCVCGGASCSCDVCRSLVWTGQQRWGLRLHSQQQWLLSTGSIQHKGSTLDVIDSALVSLSHGSWSVLMAIHQLALLACTAESRCSALQHSRILPRCYIHQVITSLTALSNGFMYYDTLKVQALCSRTTHLWCTVRPENAKQSFYTVLFIYSCAVLCL